MTHSYIRKLVRAIQTPFSIRCSVTVGELLPLSHA